MLDSPWTLLPLMLAVTFVVLGLAYVFQDLEEEGARRQRCPACRQPLEGRPAFCPECGARSRN